MESAPPYQNNFTKWREMNIFYEIYYSKFLKFNWKAEKNVYGYSITSFHNFEILMRSQWNFFKGGRGGGQGYFWSIFQFSNMLKYRLMRFRNFLQNWKIFSLSREILRWSSRKCGLSIEIQIFKRDFWKITQNVSSPFFAIRPPKLVKLLQKNVSWGSSDKFLIFWFLGHLRLILGRLWAKSPKIAKNRP